MGGSSDFNKLRNLAVVATLRVINANLGQWKDKKQQEDALVPLLKQRRLMKRNNRPGLENQPHSSETLRNILVDLISKYPATRPGERGHVGKKSLGILTVFEKGSKAFSTHLLEQLRATCEAEGQTFLDEDGEHESEATQREVANSDVEGQTPERKTSGLSVHPQGEGVRGEKHPAATSRGSSVDADGSEYDPSVHERAPKVHAKKMNGKGPSDKTRNQNAVSVANRSKALGGKRKAPANDESESATKLVSTPSGVYRSRSSQPVSKQPRLTTEGASSLPPASSPAFDTTQEITPTPSKKTAIRPVSAAGTVDLTKSTGKTSKQPAETDLHGIGLREAEIDGTFAQAPNPEKASERPKNGPLQVKSADTQEQIPARDGELRNQTIHNVITASPILLTTVGDSRQQTQPQGQLQEEHFRALDLSIGYDDVEKAQNSIWLNIRDITNDLFEHRGVDKSALAEFHQQPSAQLRDLYATVFSWDWQERVVALQLGKNAKLNNERVLRGLISAGIFRSVFKDPTPWNPRSFGTNMDLEYLRRALESKGTVHSCHGIIESILIGETGLRLDDVLAQTMMHRMADPQFSNTVTKQATELAQTLSLTLIPHILSSKATKTAKEGSGPFTWSSALRDVFQDALNLKSKMEATNDRKYEISWIEASVVYDRTTMDGYLGPKNAKKVVMALSPCITAKRAGVEVELASPARVVMM